MARQPVMALAMPHSMPLRVILDIVPLGWVANQG